MKMTIKKAVSILLTAVMAFLSAVSIGKYDFGDIGIKAEAATTRYTEGYYTYTVDENNNATIINVDTSISGDIVIPSTFDDHSLTNIGDRAFEICDSITSIEIPDSITNIGDRAFWGCESLISVTIGKSVISIGEGAFAHCYSLTNIEIPDSVTSIDEVTFGHCYSLTSIEIPESITSIGYKAFTDCTGLTSIEIPDSVTSIVDGAFFNCLNLSNITIPDSVTNIGDYAFSGAFSMEYIHVPSSITIIGSNLIDSVSEKESKLQNIKEEIQNMSAEYLVKYAKKGITEESIAKWEIIKTAICSDTENCYAKKYADENGLEFKVCSGDHVVEVPNEPKTRPTTEPTTQPATTMPVVTESSTTKPVEALTTAPITTKHFIEPTTMPSAESTTKPYVEEEIIKNPSKTRVKYGETLILHADFSIVPEGAAIEWSVEGDGVTIKPSDDGKTCAVNSTATGDVTVTAKYVDANGVEHVSEQEIESNASIWQKIVSFFKNLFGMNRIIDQSVVFDR